MDSIIYCYREVVNKEDIGIWLNSLNLIEPIDINDLHLTVSYKKDEILNDIELDNYMYIVPHNNRKINILGTTLVLSITSIYLQNRWNYYIENEYHWDYNDYKPHISLSYNYKNYKFLGEIEPFDGDIILGPEIIKMKGEQE